MDPAVRTDSAAFYGHEHKWCRVAEEQYGPGGELVSQRLEDGGTQFFEGGAGKERLVRAVTMDHDTQFFTGPPGAERIVRVEFEHDGVLSKMHYCGDRGHERLAKTVCSDGSCQFFKGARGKEHCTHITTSNGSVVHFVGGKGLETKTRVLHADGQCDSYLGRRGHEKVSRVQYADGRDMTIEYPHGTHTRRTRLQFPNGDTEVREGPCSAERLVRATRCDASGAYDVVFEGAAGVERESRRNYSDGRVVTYTGMAGQESIHIAWWPDGHCQCYMGRAGMEKVWDVSTTAPGGPGEKRDVRRAWACEPRDPVAESARRSEKRKEKKHRRRARRSGASAEAPEDAPVPALEAPEDAPVPALGAPEDAPVPALGARAVAHAADDVPEDTLCVICMEEPKTRAMIPCGHLCVCEGCAQLDACPLCRVGVAATLRVFV